MNSKVSVIMATYQTEEKQLKEAINSILKQTYQNLELIIVCDGICKDSEIIEQFQDDRIIMIQNEQNKGLPASLNIAIDRASGEYIARMDSDDIATYNRIEEQVKFMEKHRDITVCSMFAKLIGDEKGYKTIIDYKPEEIKCQLLFRTCMIHPCVMIRAERLADKYRYDEEFKCAQDFELWTRMCQTEKMQMIPKVGLYYRVHKKQASIAKQKQQMEFATKILARNLKYIGYQQEDTKAMESLLILSGKKQMNEENRELLSKWIEETLEKNKNNGQYSIKVLKKILYTRFFILLCKKKKGFITALKNKSMRKQIFYYQNLYFIIKTFGITIKLKLGI